MTAPGRDPTGTAAIESQALPAAPEQAGTLVLRPFQPDLRAIDAVQRALRAAAGPDGWAPVERALAPVFGRPAPTAGEIALARASEALTAALSPARLDGPPPAVLLGEAAHQLLVAVTPSLPTFTDPRAEFISGLLVGVAEGLVDEAKSQIVALKDVIQAVVDFYVFVYDINVLAGVFQVWIDDPAGTALDDLTAYLKTDYPGLWRALTQLTAVMRALDALVRSLSSTDDGAQASALSRIGDWLYVLPSALGGTLRPSVAAIVDAAGNPKEQGRVVGQLAAPVIVQITLAAVSLRELGANVVRFAAKQGPLLAAESETLAAEALAALREGARSGYSGEELAAAATHSEKVAPGLGNAGVAISEGILQQLVREWGELGYRIAPHRLHRRETGAWNAAVRKFLGVSIRDPEYAVQLRLDSHHIIGDKWYAQFPDEFKRVFTDRAVLDSRGMPVLIDGQPLVITWNSAEDMDCIALHTEAHIRSGERMSKDLGLLGAEGRSPLENEMKDFFAALRRDKDGVEMPFKGLADVVRAHKLFYQRNRERTLWPRVNAWFDRVEAAMAARVP